MSGGYRGSNGRGTTAGTGLPAVVGRMAREGRDRRGSRPSRRVVDFPIPAAVALDGAASYTIPLDPPFSDEQYLATADLLAADLSGQITGLVGVLDWRPDAVVVSMRAVKAVPAGAIIRLQAIHP